MAKRWKILIAIGLAVAVVDQWTKFWALKNLTPAIALEAPGASLPIKTDARRNELLDTMGPLDQLGAFFSSGKHPCNSAQVRCPTVVVVDGFWNHRYVENPGAAWGLLANASENVRVPFFLLISVAAIIFIISFFRKLDDSQMLLVIALSLVFGGAIGNFIDRLHLSYVIDFIDWYIGNDHWPTFNFADAAITTGVSLLLLEWLIDAIRGRNDKESSAAAGAK